ncbi:Putative enoyl-CoA hydratase/isomerase [Mycobacteroides abscessus]|nr:Putative enoyl-CoA hydratase/isomerase [Mycobacteroides abscessus]
MADSLHASGSSASDSLHASGSSADGWKAFTVETTGHIAQVTLIGPGKGNAMGPDFWRELPLIFAELDADPEVRAVVLAAAGRHFSYGLDLPAMAGTFMPLMAEKALAKPRTDFLDEIRRLQASVTAVADCRKPVIAAIQGWCIGGGVDLIAAADIRYASSEAKFSVREAKVAIVADIGSLHRLPPIIGDGHLRELAFTGKDIDAARAEKIGLILFTQAAHRCLAGKPSPSRPPGISHRSPSSAPARATRWDPTFGESYR